MKTLILLTAALLWNVILPQDMQAQDLPVSGKISGKVLDEKKERFPYVSVSLLQAKDSVVLKGTITDDQGSFTFPKLIAGSYLLKYQVVGYSDMVKGPFVISSEKLAAEVPAVGMLTTVKQLNNVNVTARKPLIERQVDKTVLNIENSALATGNTALEILQKAPGVSVDKDGNISLRGKKGVTVMIDGKPTYLSSEQLANLLRSTEGNSIQSIELVTNPSAKYDAAGNSGIINIKLKKNSNFGTNGTVTAGAGYGKYGKWNTGLSLNHRQKKFNFYGDINYSRNKRFHVLNIDRVNETEENKTFFDQKSNAVGRRRNMNYKAGFDYFITDNHTVGVAVNGYRSTGKNDVDVSTAIGSQRFERDSSVIAFNPNDYKYTGITYNLNYKGTLDTTGQEINVDADYSRYLGNPDNLFENNYLDKNGQVYKAPFIFRNATPSTVNIYTAKADYTYPINKKMKLEAGVKASKVNTDNNSIFENFVENQWQNDVTRSNQFIYDERIQAGYVNLNKQFSGLTVQLGLRGENTNSKGNSITENKIVNRQYFDLFPSLFVNRELSKNHDLGFSYSRRIDRPDYESLNPFIFFVDLYTYGIGNPFLKPQYTNSFELSYGYKKMINVTMGYSHTSDVITRVLVSDTAKKTLFISSQNLAVRNAYNMNISSPVNFTKWWTSSNNLTVYYNEFKTPDLLGVPYESGKLAFNLNTNQTITLDPNTKFEMSGFYQSAQVEGTLSLKAFYGVDLGVSRTFMDKKLNVKVAANDVFYTQKYHITSALPGQNYRVNERNESRVLRLTCSYRFGNSGVKAARQRSKSSDAESNRVKSGG